MNVRVFCIAATLAGLAGTARAEGPEKPRLRFWGVEVRDRNRCTHSSALDTAIADQLEQLGKPVLVRPTDGAFRAGCMGMDCVSQWPPAPPAAKQESARNTRPEPDRMLGGLVEPSSKGGWRGRLWYYVEGARQVAVRDVVASSKEHLTTEMAYAAAALVFSPDPLQTITSRPTYCATVSRPSQFQGPGKGPLIHISIYRRPGLELFAQALAKGLSALVRQLGASSRVVEFPKPRDKYMDKDEACKPEKRSGASLPRQKSADCPPPRPESALIEAEFVQGIDLDDASKPTSALQKVRLRWRGADGRGGEPRERSLAVPPGTSPEALVRTVTRAFRPKLAGVVDGMELPLDRCYLTKQELDCTSFTTQACSGGTSSADECKDGPEPPKCREVYCGAHPDDKRCKQEAQCLGPEQPGCQAIYCATHPNDSRCSQSPPACGGPSQEPCKKPTNYSIGARKTFTFIFAGMAAVSTGLFIWRATENNKFVGGDCAAPDAMMDLVKNSCIQRTFPTMLETGLPALGLLAGAFGIWPWTEKPSPSVKQQATKASRQ